jgi:HEAT repeat protein
LTALRLIWTASLVLAAAALAVMLLLALLRFWTNRQRARHAAARRRLAPLLLGGGEVTPAAAHGISDAVIADLSLELIQLVRGAERQAFIANAARLGVPRRLARQMRSISQRKRTVALRGLVEFDDPVSRRALDRALDDPAPDIRLAAAQALAERGEPLDARDLVRRLGLGSEHSPRTMVRLFRSIAQARPDQVKALVLEPDQNLDVRLAAIEAMADTGDYSLVPVLAALALEADDGSEELPRYLHALGKLGHPSGKTAILAGLSSGSMAARAAAARAVGRIALTDSVDRLGQLLNDREWWVRFRAAEALLGLGDAGLARLRAAAAHGYGPAREAAGTMLAERGLRP